MAAVNYDLNNGTTKNEGLGSREGFFEKKRKDGGKG